MASGELQRNSLSRSLGLDSFTILRQWIVFNTIILQAGTDASRVHPRAVEMRDVLERNFPSQVLVHFMTKTTIVNCT